MQNLWFFVVVIIVPLIITIMAVFTGLWLKLKEKQLDHAAALTAQKASNETSQVKQLEQRMRVLERIITDRGIVVADEIEKLR